MSGIDRPDFNPLPSCEGRRFSRSASSCSHRFQSTPLMRGETCTRRLNIWWTAYFNPLPSHEGRRSARAATSTRASFQSTSLIRGETLGIDIDKAVREFQSAPLMRGETASPASSGSPSSISILSLMRGETIVFLFDAFKAFISIHSPHARGDPAMSCALTAACSFQSTPLMRGETACDSMAALRQYHFNPLPSCEGRRNRAGEGTRKA